MNERLLQEVGVDAVDLCKHKEGIATQTETHAVTIYYVRGRALNGVRMLRSAAACAAAARQAGRLLRRFMQEAPVASGAAGLLNPKLALRACARVFLCVWFCACLRARVCVNLQLAHVRACASGGLCCYAHSSSECGGAGRGPSARRGVPLDAETFQRNFRNALQVSQPSVLQLGGPAELGEV